MVAFPDLLARMVKCPIDLLHDKVCPCAHWDRMEETAALAIALHTAAGERPAHPDYGSTLGGDAR